MRRVRDREAPGSKSRAPPTTAPRPPLVHAQTWSETADSI